MEVEKDEVALYDRQIRLWGLHAQQRIRNGNVLLIGVQHPNFHEIAKNLTLSGIGHLSLLSSYHDSFIEESDIQQNLFFSPKDVGRLKVDVLKEKLLILNNNVHISIFHMDTNQFKNEDLIPFDIIALASNDPIEMRIWGTRARDSNIKLYVTGCIGFYGWNFCDFGDFSYTKESEQSNEMKDEETKLIYSPLSSIFNILEKEELVEQDWHPDKNDLKLNTRQKAKFEKWIQKFRLLWFQLSNKILKEFSFDKDLEEWSLQLSTYMKGEAMAPVVSIVASHASQDILRGISMRGKPLYNSLLFNGWLVEAESYHIA